MEQNIIDQNKISEETARLLAEAAQRQAEDEQTSIPFVSLKGKKFSIGDEKLGTVLNTVILADVLDNSYYDRPYDPSSDEVFPPACFSIYHDLNEAVPDDTSPTAMHENCLDCPMNKFESARQGKGKACRNGRRILIASVDSEGRVNFADLSIVNMSPTALKSFSRYVKGITVTKKLPLWAVITQLSFEEDSSYPVLQTAYMADVHPQDLEIAAKRLQEFQDLVEVPYDVSNYQPLEPEDPSKVAKKSKMS